MSAMTMRSSRVRGMEARRRASWLTLSSRSNLSMRSVSLACSSATHSGVSVKLLRRQCLSRACVGSNKAPTLQRERAKKASGSEVHKLHVCARKLQQVLVAQGHGFGPDGCAVEQDPDGALHMG